jgi:hypothetical protein
LENSSNRNVDLLFLSNRFIFARAYYCYISGVFQLEMSFVLSLSDFGMWLAVSSLIMLTAVELTSPFYASRSDVSFKRKKIRRVAVGFAIAFVAVALIRITFLVL